MVSLNIGIGDYISLVNTSIDVNIVVVSSWESSERRGVVSSLEDRRAHLYCVCAKALQYHSFRTRQDPNTTMEEATTIIEDSKLTTFFSRQSEVFMGISFIFLSLVGVIGNTYTILVMIFRKRLYNCCTPYLISVSISDLIMTAIILPVAGLNAVSGLSYIPIQMCKGISIIFHILLGKIIFHWNNKMPRIFLNFQLHLGLGWRWSASSDALVFGPTTLVSYSITPRPWSVWLGSFPFSPYPTHYMEIGGRKNTSELDSCVGTFVVSNICCM